MKKLIVKGKIIDIPFSPAIPGKVEKWVKDELEVFELPMIEIDGELVPDDSFTYYPFIEEVPEQPEVSHIGIIAQTQGEDDELAIWLDGDKHKYPEGYTVEYIDISEQVEQEKINQESLEYLASTDWLIVREIDANIPCPLDIKQKRQEARDKIVR
jgi:hypothetical protein